MQLTDEQRNKLVDIRGRINENVLKLKYIPEDLAADDPIMQALEYFRKGLDQLSLVLDKGPAQWKERAKPQVIDCGTFDDKPIRRDVRDPDSAYGKSRIVQTTL